jgi:hypothetical protein
LNDKKTNVRQDLKQIYLLHVNEYYKNAFLTQLRSLVSYGLVAAIVLALLAFGIAFLVNPPERISGGIASTKDYAIDSSWRNTGNIRATGAGSAEVQVLVNIRAKNLSPSQPLTVTAIIPEDSLGMRIPVVIESMDPLPLVVPANATAVAVVLAWVPESLRNAIYRFQRRP